MTLRNLLEKATPLPWRWWTSCSWRRLYGNVDSRGTHPVMMPTNHPKDRQPDIAVTDADMALVENAVNFLPLLLAVKEAAEKAKSVIDDYLNPRINTGVYSERYEKDFLYIQAELDAALAALREKEGRL